MGKLMETAVFFDLDDTLYDRSEPFQKAFLEHFPERAELAKQAYWACEKRGNEVFLPSQRGEITMDEMYIYRYRKGLSDTGISISAEQALDFQAVYREKQKEITLAAGIPELLDFCKEHCRAVGVITNGPSEKQKGKLKTLGIEKWIPKERILISGVLKIDKPDPRIFRLAEEVSATAAANMLYVGDSLPNDIRPAAALGWKTIYLNRKKKPLEEGDVCPDLLLEGEEILKPEHLETLIGL